jgi:beta-galactosidase
VGFSYPELFLNYFRAFHRLGIPVDVVSPEADLSSYRLVIAPTLYVLHQSWVANLRRYVEDGGTLVIGARSGVKDASNRVVNMPLPGLLRELCGIEVSEYDALGRAVGSAIRFEPGVIESAEVLCPIHTWCDIIDPLEAEVIARYAEEYYAGQPAITRNRFGKGSVVYVGVMGGNQLCGALAAWLSRQAQLRPLLATPEGVEVVARERDGITYLFVLNHTDTEQIIEVPYPCTDLISERRYEGRCPLPAREVLILVAS